MYCLKVGKFISSDIPILTTKQKPEPLGYLVGKLVGGLVGSLEVITVVAIVPQS